MDGGHFGPLLLVAEIGKWMKEAKRRGGGKMRKACGGGLEFLDEAKWDGGTRMEEWKWKMEEEAGKKR